MDAPPVKHFSEARRDAISAVLTLVGSQPSVEKAVLIQDLFGLLRVLLWIHDGTERAPLVEKVDTSLREAGLGYWTGDIWLVDSNSSGADLLVYDSAWEEGTELTSKVRIDDRHRNRTAWFTRSRGPLWMTPEQTMLAQHQSGVDSDATAPRAGFAAVSPEEVAEESVEGTRTEVGPPVIVFSSFKGGVGRTTALASFAIQRARAGDRVAVIDFDLDAPGVGTLLAADEQGTTAQLGVVDYLLECTLGQAGPIDAFIHRCAREKVSGDGAILVVPAGALDDDYLTKLSRIDLELFSPEQPHPLDNLLRAVRDRLVDGDGAQGRSWILLDARAGLSPAAGLLLSGIAHLHVLFATTSEQSLLGLERMVHHLGVDRLREDKQGDLLVVQAMVPDNTVTGAAAREVFASRIEDMLRVHYLVPEDDDDADKFWSVRDTENREGPHAPIPIPYRENVAFFRLIDDIADSLAEEPPYRELSERILGRFPSVTDLDEQESEA